MGYFRQALTGTGWMGAFRLLTRGMGFVKIVILARILTPKDFGVFGIAAIALAFLETFTEPGVSLALIQQKEDIDEYVSTAWLISITRGFLIATLMFLLSAPIAEFFHEPAAEALLKLAAAIPLVKGFLNPAAVDFVKKLQFNKEFVLRTLPMALDIGSAIILALYMRSPLAIVLGMLFAAAFEVVLTFTMTHLRPTLSFVKSHAKKLLGYGKWVTLGWITNYLAEQFDDIVVGRLLGAASLGVYQMAFKLSVLPSTELSEVVSKVVFPVYSRISGDRERLGRAVVKTTLVIGAISLPAIGLFVLFPHAIIALILGDQWLAAAAPLRLLALYGLTRSISQPASAAIYAVGRPDIAAKIRGLQFIIMAIVLVPLVKRFDLSGAALAIGVAALVAQLPLWLTARKFLWETRET